MSVDVNFNILFLGISWGHRGLPTSQNFVCWNLDWTPTYFPIWFNPANPFGHSSTALTHVHHGDKETTRDAKSQQYFWPRRPHPIGTPLRWSPDVKVPTGSFAPFAALKSLYIGLSDLLGTWGEQRPEPAPPAPAHGSEQDIRDILPLSLKTLWLYCSDDDLFALCIGRLAEVLRQTPGLSDTKITLDGTVAVFEDYFLHTRPEFERTDAQWNLEKLGLLCQERGITLDICGEPDACESDEAEETDNSDDSEVPDDADLADDVDYLDGSRDPTYRDCSENEDDTEDEDDMRWSNKAMSYAAPAGGHGARATVLFFPQ